MQQSNAIDPKSFNVGIFHDALEALALLVVFLPEATELEDFARILVDRDLVGERKLLALELRRRPAVEDEVGSHFVEGVILILGAIVVRRNPNRRFNLGIDTWSVGGGLTKRDIAIDAEQLHPLHHT